MISRLSQVFVQCLLIKLTLLAFNFSELSLEFFKCVDLPLNKWELIYDAFVLNLIHFSPCAL